MRKDFLTPLYIRDLKVYKVIIAVNPSMLKKAKKLGLNGQYTTIYFEASAGADLSATDVPINIPNLNVSSGSYIALYNPNDGTCSVFNGEETEEEQRAKLEAKKASRNNSRHRFI